MFQSKAKQRAHEAFMARQTFKSKAQKRADFRSRLVLKKREHNENIVEQALSSGCVHVIWCKPQATPRVGELNRKKAKSVANPLQSWVAHW